MINKIEVSYLLGMNDFIVDPFLEECSAVVHLLEEYRKLAIEDTKQCQEVHGWYKDMFNKYNKKIFVKT